MSADNDLTAYSFNWPRRCWAMQIPCCHRSMSGATAHAAPCRSDLAKATWFDFEANERRIGLRASSPCC